MWTINIILTCWTIGARHRTFTASLSRGVGEIIRCVGPEKGANRAVHSASVVGVVCVGAGRAGRLTRQLLVFAFGAIAGKGCKWERVRSGLRHEERARARDTCMKRQHVDTCDDLQLTAPVDDDALPLGQSLTHSTQVGHD